MPAVVFLRDRFVGSLAEAQVSLFDRGYLLGDSIFETLRVYGGVPFALDAHLDRLEHASRVTGIPLVRERAELVSLVQAAVERSALGSAYVRITISRGEGGRGIGTVGCESPTLSVIVRELHPLPDPNEGIAAATLELRRIPPECLDPSMKTGNYLNSVLARREVERRGLGEGVMLSTGDMVVSGTVSNVFVYDGELLRTPDETSGCRLGVTRDVVLRLADELGVGVVCEPLEEYDLGSATEMFFTSTLVECLPVRSFDGEALASAVPGSFTRRLLDAYREEVSSHGSRNRA